MLDVYYVYKYINQMRIIKRGQELDWLLTKIKIRQRDPLSLEGNYLNRFSLNQGWQIGAMCCAQT